MRRGTTPTLVFHLPFDTSMVKEAYVTLKYYKGNGIETLEKDTDACIRNGSDIAVKLTQEETLNFPAGKNIDIQLRVLTYEDNALVSQIFSEPAERILKDGVI